MDLPAVPVRDLLSLLAACEARGLPVWLAGGWAVDARVGVISRPHAEIELRVAPDRLENIEALLRERCIDTVLSGEHGFLALGNDRVVEVLACGRDGRGCLSRPHDGWPCPDRPDASLCGTPVRCLSWEGLLLDYVVLEQGLATTQWRPQDLYGKLEVIRALGRQRAGDLRRAFLAGQGASEAGGRAMRRG